MTAELSGRTCLVTGANSGIGKETARGLAEKGARVIVAFRDAVAEEALWALCENMTSERHG